MATAQMFDFGKAADLQTKLKNEIGSIKDTLRKTKTMVEGCREWWKGGSEEAFINNFEKTKKEVENSLEKWLNEYSELVKKVAETKQSQDDEIKKALAN